MKLRMPSYRVQIMLLVIGVVMIAAFMMREVFLTNMAAYQEQVNDLSGGEELRTLYREYAAGMDSTAHDHFSRQIENIMIGLHKIELAGEFYSRDIRWYTMGLVLFMIFMAVVIFLMAFGMITRPLARLTSATEALRQGDFSVQIKEFRYSPLNDLIVAFNTMIKELVDRGEKLIEAEKQVIWREMARAMAHEIKNPLTPIRLSAQRLEAKYYADSPDLPEVLEKSLGIINEEVNNLQSLVTSFSGFAKMPEARLETYNLNHQIEEIIAQYSDSATIDMILDDRLETIHADQLQIKQVLVNLVQNAIQACTGDPHLTIRTETGDSQCRIQIIDSGPGIPENHLRKIFEPYFTTKKKGTGLGLAICRRIIRQHGGDIKVYSTLNEGSTFTIQLPCRLASGEQASEEA